MKVTTQILHKGTYITKSNKVWYDPYDNVIVCDNVISDLFNISKCELIQLEISRKEMPESYKFWYNHKTYEYYLNDKHRGLLYFDFVKLMNKFKVKNKGIIKEIKYKNMVSKGQPYYIRVIIN